MKRWLLEGEVQQEELDKGKQREYTGKNIPQRDFRICLFSSMAAKIPIVLAAFLPLFITLLSGEST